MAKVFQPNDGFNLTFGKEEWKNYNKSECDKTLKNTLGRSKIKSSYNNPSASHKKQQNIYSLQFQKALKNNSARKRNFDKQNLNSNQISNQNNTHRLKPRRRSSIFDHKKITAFEDQLNIFNLTQQIKKQKQIHEQSMGSKKQNFNSLYEVQLKNRLKQIQNSSRKRSDRYYKVLGEQETKIREEGKVFVSKDNNRDKRTTQIQQRKKVLPRYYESENVQKQRYSDEMRKIDGLIDKINTRIKNSIKNFS